MDDQASSGPDPTEFRKGQMPEYSDMEKLLHAVQRSNLHTRQIRTRCGCLVAILLSIAFMMFIVFINLR